MDEDIGDVYRKATQCKNECDRILEALESGRDQSVASQQRLGGLSGELNHVVTQLEGMARNLPERAQQNMWTRRIAPLVADRDQIRQAVDKQLGSMNSVERERREREELFGARQRGSRKSI